MGRRQTGAEPSPFLALLWSCSFVSAASLGTFRRGDLEDGAVSLFQHSLRRAQRSDLVAELTQERACPAGYSKGSGDVPGWDQFGRHMSNKQPTAERCAADCNARQECTSFEWSPSTEICSLNKAAATLASFEDYVLCLRQAEVSEPKGCPAGYELLEGDVPGWDQFGRGDGNKKDSLELCVAECEERQECLSAEWSPTSKTCSLNKVGTPTTAKFQDFTFCRRRQQASTTPTPPQPPAAPQQAPTTPPPPQLPAATQQAPTTPPPPPLPAATQQAPATPPAAPSQQVSAAGSVGAREEAGRIACPAGYEFVEGDIPGGDQFGRGLNRKPTMESCAADCSRKTTCKSLEWSPSRKACNLNKVDGPVVAKYKDFVLCQRKAGEPEAAVAGTPPTVAPAAPPDAKLAVPPAAVPGEATAHTPSVGPTAAPPLQLVLPSAAPVLLAAAPALAAVAPAPAAVAPAVGALAPVVAPEVAATAAPTAAAMVAMPPAVPTALPAAAAIAGEAPAAQQAPATQPQLVQEAVEVVDEAVVLPEDSNDPAASAGVVAQQTGQQAVGTTAKPVEPAVGLAVEGDEEADAEVSDVTYVEASPTAPTASPSATETVPPAEGERAALGPEGKPAAGGNPDCWVDGYSFGSCCSSLYGQRGNQNCWDGKFTYERCCFPKEAPSLPPPAEPPPPTPQSAPIAAQPPPAPIAAQPLPAPVSYQVGEFVEVADAEGHNPLTAWLPAIVLARGEATYGVRLALSADGQGDAVLSNVPVQLLRKADSQRHAYARERLAHDPVLAAKAAREVTHELAELEAADEALKAATANGHAGPSVQPLQLSQAAPAAPKPEAWLPPTPAPIPAWAQVPDVPRMSLSVGDFAEVKLLGPPSEGKPGPWLACTVSGAGDAPHAYDIHFLGVPQAYRDIQDVPGYMVRKAESKQYAQSLRRMRDDPRAAVQAVMRLRQAVGQGGEGVEADSEASRETDKIRAAWDARKRFGPGAKDKRLDDEQRLQDVEKEQAAAAAKEQEKRKAAAIAKRRAEKEAKRKADEEAKEEALRQAKEEMRQKMEEEVKQKVEQELKRKADEDAQRKAAARASAELRRKTRQAEMEGRAAKGPAAGGKDVKFVQVSATRPTTPEVSEGTSLRAMAKDGDPIHLRVRDGEGHTVQLKIGRRVRMRAILNAACDKLLLPREYVLNHNGVTVKASDTPEALGLRDQDMLEAAPPSR